jgi:dipeptidyl aminopeptidase/acylaminoacyl peptidase
MRIGIGIGIGIGLVLALAASATAQPARAPTLAQFLAYPFVSDLVSADRADRIAWVETVKGVRNIWTAEGPAFTPRALTHATEDDGQELTGLVFSSDGETLLYVRGGDHDANWPADGDLQPDPNASPEQPKVTIWRASLSGGAPVMITEGDNAVLSAKGVLAYVKNHQVWTIALDGQGKPEPLFFDRGKDQSLAWSPDGSKLAFVSGRGDHAFIGVFTDKSHPLVYMAPSTGRDDSPVWSPDGTLIAFTREPGEGGAPLPLLTQTPKPWSIITADAASGRGGVVWHSPDTFNGAFPNSPGGANLMWAADGKLAFTAELDGWPHLYALNVKGGALSRLTPGPFMVEDLALSRDKRTVVFSANAGNAPGDIDRRHLFRVSIKGGTPVELTPGEGLQTGPVFAALDRVAFVSATATRPFEVALISLQGGAARDLPTGAAAAYPSAALVTPRLVNFTAPDGTPVQGQLFQRPGAHDQPAVIFVHGGPPRQMLLGWHYMDYYSNAYAVNQDLAAHGFTVLSVNYRLGIGYGRAFQEPPHAGYAGASEYQDVMAGARVLQKTEGVDPTRIGIWGGSYGGYLTGLALARNSDVFKAGVDYHGVHDWSQLLSDWGFQPPTKRYEQGDWRQALKVAFEASPDADVKTWRSPVLLIQGDDDRNVPFHQTVDLADRLTKQGVDFEEMVIPNEIHGFLRYASWLQADTAAVDFLERKLAAGQAPH